MRDEMHGSCHRCVVDRVEGPLCPECYEALREWWIDMWDGINEVTAVMR